MRWCGLGGVEMSDTIDKAIAESKPARLSTEGKRFWSHQGPLFRDALEVAVKQLRELDKGAHWQMAKMNYIGDIPCGYCLTLAAIEKILGEK